jgi:PAS domain S-box-containing protein
MQVSLPLIRTRVPTARAPALRYGVAVLSIILALIPAFLLSDVAESRLAVFAVAIMVSAWYGGWKPGLVATSFALTVSAYFSLTGDHTAREFWKTIIDLSLFVVVALLICWFNAALRSTQESLQRSEAAFRSLVTNAPYGICRCDSSGIILEANPALVRTLSYLSAAGLIGQNLANMYADSQQWFTLADYFRSLKPFQGVMGEWRCRDASTKILRISGRASRDERNAIFFELFTEDVTERRALEQQLRQAQKMEAIGRLAGGIAHDFNNLLMVISGYCEFLLERVRSDSSLRGPAQEIANAAGRATSLTRQLLAFSRKQMLAPKVIDLNAVVSENLRMLTRLIGEDIDLVMIPGPALGAVKADPGQIEQVIMNLAVNARDAMPHGGKLTIETSNISLNEAYARSHAPIPPGDYVILSISDTGLGMDSETQAHIFEPFFTTKGVRGTGLGLSTVYGIVKQSGGFIWVESQPGRGSSFRIHLPRVSEIAEAVEAPATPVARPESASETVLVVEDEANVRHLAREYLQQIGYSVLEAADSTEALEISAAYQGAIHLLLTDVIMPGMNGRELAQRFCAQRPGAKVIFMSGYTENAIGHNGTLDNGIVLLQKPFTLAALKTKVREMLHPIRPAKEGSLPSFSQDEMVPNQDKAGFFRAQRFNLQVPVRYRLEGEPLWRKGMTENISRSGLLFRVEKIVQPSTAVEISLVLPPEIAGLVSAEVTCRGEVVRTLEAESPGLSPALAARILRYQFQQGPHLPEA